MTLKQLNLVWFILTNVSSFHSHIIQVCTIGPLKTKFKDCMTNGQVFKLLFYYLLWIAIIDLTWCSGNTNKRLFQRVQTSVLGLGVNFVLPMSQQQEQHEQEQEQLPPKSILNLTLKSKSCYYKKGLKIHKKKMH